MPLPAQRIQRVGASLANPQFVTYWYQDALLRTPSEGEVDAWVTVMQGGSSQVGVTHSILYSGEMAAVRAGELAYVSDYSSAVAACVGAGCTLLPAPASLVANDTAQAGMKLRLRYTNAYGVADFGTAQLIISAQQNVLNGVGACQLGFDAAGNYNLGGVPGPASNQYCSVASFSAVPLTIPDGQGGTTVAVDFTFDLTFAQVFEGNHTVYAGGWNRETLFSGWTAVAQLNVPARMVDLVTSPSATSVLPGGTVSVSVGLTRVRTDAASLSYSAQCGLVVAGPSAASGAFVVSVTAGATTGACGIVVSGWEGGATDTATILINVNAPLSASCAASPASPIVGQPVSFTAAPAGGMGGYTYTWSGAVGGTTAAVTFKPTISQGYSESVTVRDSAGTLATASCAVTVRKLVSVAELTTCIRNAPSGGVCTLESSGTPYQVTETILIDRSDVTVRGDAASMNATRIVQQIDLLRPGDEDLTPAPGAPYRPALAQRAKTFGNTPPWRGRYSLRIPSGTGSLLR